MTDIAGNGPAEFAEGERPSDYEACGVCGFDHEYEPEQAQASKCHVTQEVECATCGGTREVAGDYFADDGIGPCPDCAPEPASDRFFDYGVTL